MIFNPDDTDPDIHRIHLFHGSARNGTIAGTVSRDKAPSKRAGKFGNVTEFGDPIPIVNIGMPKIVKHSS